MLVPKYRSIRRKKWLFYPRIGIFRGLAVTFCAPSGLSGVYTSPNSLITKVLTKMKKTFIIALAFLMVGTLSAQNIIDEAFSHYKQNEDYTKVRVSGTMFEMASEMEVDEEDNDMQDIKEMVSDIESFQMILGVEETETEQKYKDGVSIIRSRYEELMTVDGKEGRFSLYIDEENGIVYELVMIGASPDKFLVASLVGEMDLRKLGQITKRIQKEGSALGSIVTDEGHEVKIYPNPSPTGGVISLEVSDNLVDADVQVLDLSGQVVKEWILAAKASKMPSEDLAAGRYVLQISNKDRTVRRKFIVQ